MSDWLFREDNYIPKTDKDNFIDKSILSILELLSNIKKGSINNFTKGMYGVNPVLKLLCTFLILISLSICKEYMYIELVDIYMFFIIIQLDRNTIKKILLLSFTIPLFTLVMLIPAMLMGNVSSSLRMLLKIFSSLLAVNILNYTTRWDGIIKALKVFRIPDIFIFTIEITFRYIYILGDFSIDMLYSLKLKSIGKDENKYKALSEMMSTLFIKSKDMGNELFSAMECRGFSGEYSNYFELKLKFNDFVYIIFNSLLIIMFLFI